MFILKLKARIELTMNQEIFKKIEINDTMSLEFWNSEAQIKNYCEGILNHSGNAKYTVTIKFSGSDAFVTTTDKINYTITLPKTELLTDENLKLKNIIARTVFLRHELAHVLFTDFNLQNQITKDVRTFNMFDDARIENLYSRQYKGTYRLFRALIKNIYEHGKNNYFIQHANIEEFAMYCRVREKGIMPDIKNIALETLYESMYKKYRYIFHNDYQTLINGVKSMIQEFDSIEQDRQEAIKNQPAEEENSESEEEEIDNDADDDTQEEESDDLDKPDDEQEESENDSDESGDDSETDEEEVETESGNGEESDESDIQEECENDFDESQGSIADESEQEEEQDEVQQTVDEVFGAGDTDKKSPDFEYSKLLQNVSEQKTVFNIEQYDFDPKDFREAQVIEFDKISRYILTQEEVKFVKINKRKNTAREAIKWKSVPFNRQDSQVIYNSIVSQHKKTIVETINYLKLKLKIRNNDRVLRHQIDGRLDQRNLKDILTNKNMPEVFYTTIKSLKTDSAFYFLIDFSSSMGKTEKKDAIVCCIILTEICKALNIAYEIGLFASSGYETLRVNSIEGANAVVSIIAKNKNTDVKIDSNGKRKHFVAIKYDNNNLIYRLKSIRDKHTVFTEQLLANVYSQPNILSGGTPEFESVLSVIKSNTNKNMKKHIFLINDGMINNLQEIGQLANNSIVSNHRLRITISKQAYESNSSEQLVKILFEKLKVSLIHSRDFFEMNDWNLRYDKYSKKIVKYSDEIYNEYLEILNSPEKYSYVLSDANRMFADSDYNKDLGGLCINNKEYFGVDWKNVESVDLYKKAIEYAGKNGFDIHGFGIRSKYGKKYLGEEFQVFEDSKDIENSFAAKIRAIF